MADTGSPRADAESDFLRVRRQQVTAAVAARFRAAGVESLAPLALDAAVEALGRRGERSLGTLVIPLTRIVGSVDKTREFDRRFRPTSNLARSRWERIAEATRRGAPMPPIDVYKVGDLYFVADGHHRVSVARALDLDVIEAHVREIITTVSSDGVETVGDLDAKHWRRLFLDRVPLPDDVAVQLVVTEPSDYGRLAETVEAWGARRIFASGELLDAAAVARLWYAEEYLPVLSMIEEAMLRRTAETPVDAYLRVSCERYDLVREHTWDAEVMERLRPGRAKRSHG